MALYRFGKRVPKVGKGSYVSDSARVIGDVKIGSDCYIGHGAVLRGDYGSIVLGQGTAVEENATIHIRPRGNSIIGERVTIGHGAVVHCNQIHNYAVIGMGAVLSFDVEIGEWAIIAEGSVVSAHTSVPPNKIAVGVPAKITEDVQSDQKEFWSYVKNLYIDLAHQYPDKFEKIC